MMKMKMKTLRFSPESIESQFLFLSLSLTYSRKKEAKTKKGRALLSLSLSLVKKKQRNRGEREGERERERETFEREERKETEEEFLSLFRVFFSEKRMILFEKKKNRQTLWQRQRMTGSEKNLKEKKKIFSHQKTQQQHKKEKIISF